MAVGQCLTGSAFFVWMLLTLSVELNIRHASAETDLEEECSYALQMFFLQDSSWSFADDLPYIQKLLPEFVNNLTQTYEGSYLAYGSFSDIPMPELGWEAWEPTDRCFEMLVNFTTEPAEFEKVLESPNIYSGRDEKEAHLTAIHHVAKGGYFMDEMYSHGKPFVRVIIVSTDAPYHVAGDAHLMLSLHQQFREDPDRSWYMPPWNFTVLDNDGDEHLRCDGAVVEDYPTIEQVAEAIADIDALLMFLVTKKVEAHYKGLQLLLKDLGVDSVVVRIESDSSDILESLAEGLAEVRDLVCYTATSTTTSTSTSNTTTTTTTTATSTTKFELPTAPSSSQSTSQILPTHGTGATTTTSKLTPTIRATTTTATSTTTVTPQPPPPPGVQQTNQEASTFASTTTVPPSEETSNIPVIVGATVGGVAAVGAAAAVAAKAGLTSVAGASAASASNIAPLHPSVPETVEPRNVYQPVEADMFA